MSTGKIKIFGKGHALCLQRTLQASLLEESFTDVTFLTFPSSSKPLRCNKSVLAAASPVLSVLLQEIQNEDDAVVIFVDYTSEDICGLLQYIYTGQVQSNVSGNNSIKKLLEELQIGIYNYDNCEKLQANKKQCTKQSQESEIVIGIGDSSPISATTELLSDVINSEVTINISKIDTNQSSVHNQKSRAKKVKKRVSKQCKVNLQSVISQTRKQVKNLIKGTAKHHHSIHNKLIVVDKYEVTYQDPSVAGQQLEFMRNPDIYRKNCSIEKMCLKFNILPSVNTGTRNICLDWPRLNDRVGIYWDPQLYSYYQGLVKGLPPIRIYLHIEDDDRENDESDTSFVKKPNVVYSGKDKKIPRARKTYANCRLPVKTMCFVNGKTHLILDGDPKLDENIPLIDYPRIGESHLMDEDDENWSYQNAENFSEIEHMERVIEEESRRKRVLLSTLSRLKKDFSQAKQVAKEILKVSKNTEDQEGASPAIRRQFPYTSPRKSFQHSVICEVCGKMVTASWIRVHMANHQGEKPYLCEHCGRSFASSNLLKSHVHYQHNANLDYVVCEVCSKSFSKKSRLDIHMRIHSGERPYECPQCAKKFHTNGNLRKHLMVHTGERPHKCHLCDKSFAQSTNLRLHLRVHQQLVEMGRSDVRVRKPEAVYRCEFCPMTFSRERHFYVHRCSHTGEKPALPCSNCSEKFDNISELKKHKLMEHPGTVHKCEMCDKSFFKKTAMHRHMATHTEEPPPKPVFQCQHCNSQFTTAAARTVHERSHTGERPFQCPSCDKSFTSKYNFRQHLRMHSDERPFKCTHCGKAFRQPQHLRAHSYVHNSQDDPVICPICGKTFRNKILLMSHKRIHKQGKYDCISCGENFPDKNTLQIHVETNHTAESNTLVNIIVLNNNPE